jgi:hypothetical protein
MGFEVSIRTILALREDINNRAGAALSHGFLQMIFGHIGTSTEHVFLCDRSSPRTRVEDKVFTVNNLSPFAFQQ